MNRRELMQCVVVLAGCANSGSLRAALSDEQRQFLLDSPSYIDREIGYLSPDRRKIIAAMAETIIPRTDTPGAIDAGVPRYIELMAAQWLNDRERAIFEAGIADMETRIPREFGKPFHELAAEQQRAILEDMESAAGDSTWYELGNVARTFISDAPFICQVKELTVFGFFTSEVGSKEVLRYDPMPMHFDGDLPLGRDDSSWALMMLINRG